MQLFITLTESACCNVSILRTKFIDNFEAQVKEIEFLPACYFVSIDTRSIVFSYSLSSSRHGAIKSTAPSIVVIHGGSSSLLAGFEASGLPYGSSEVWAESPSRFRYLVLRFMLHLLEDGRHVILGYTTPDLCWKSANSFIQTKLYYDGWLSEGWK